MKGKIMKITASRQFKSITPAIVLMFAIGSVNAGDVAEDEVSGNNSLNDTQNVESGFSTGANANIENADIGWEWVSITSQENGFPPFPAGSGLPLDSFDYYSFDVTSGQQFIFDIDFGGVISNDPVGDGDMDSVLRLFDENDAQVAVGDDAPVDPGSEVMTDSRVAYTFLYTGLATIKVSQFDDQPLFEYSTYQLQISRDPGAVSAVPVPAAIWLFGSALIGFVGMSRRTSVKS
jgi:hypothetical protein